MFESDFHMHIIVGNNFKEGFRDIADIWNFFLKVTKCFFRASL